jgi:hypothetical protein
VLSGGLGSSPYLQKKLRARYGVRVSNAPANASDMKILLADEPQLAVVHGLLMARTQLAKIGINVYARKCCPISLGVLCREEYDQAKHQGEQVTMDPFDKKRWAERQIRWIIKKVCLLLIGESYSRRVTDFVQGDIVQTDWGVVHKYRRKIVMGHEREPWRTKVVMSTVPKHRLPRSLPPNASREGTRELCEIETVLPLDSMRPKNERWYHMRKEYNLAEFGVRLQIATGLKFEIVDKKERPVKAHEEISVDWEPVTADVMVDEAPPTMYPYQNHGRRR